MTLVNKPDKPKKILKRSQTGLETEFHLLETDGIVSTRANELIEAIRAVDKNTTVTKEIGKNMIEFGCYPDVKTYNPLIDMIDTLQEANDIAVDHDLVFYPFSTYPGKFDPVVNEGSTYVMKKKIFGPEKLAHSMRVTGFHHHYSLPKGVFDKDMKMIRVMKKSKLKRAMVGSYNFEIAADPVLTLFAQSSPYYQGKYIGKDSRVIVYRGGRKLGYDGGVYSNLQQIGGLPPYKQTAMDLMSSLKRRWVRWRKAVNKADPESDFDQLYPNKLDIGWHPVKLNKHGTLEQRGMDINYMSTISAITAILKFSLKTIQREYIEVLPTDFGVDEAFKLENGILYVPPHTYVRNSFQRWSAYSGYDSPKMTKYAKRFYKFARSVTPKRYNKLLRPLSEMIESKESMSDKIIKYAHKKGYSFNGVSDSDAKEMALYYAKLWPKDLEKTKGILEKLSAV